MQQLAVSRDLDQYGVDWDVVDVLREDVDDGIVILLCPRRADGDSPPLVPVVNGAVVEEFLSNCESLVWATIVKVSHGFVVVDTGL